MSVFDIRTMFVDVRTMQKCLNAHSRRVSLSPDKHIWEENMNGSTQRISTEEAARVLGCKKADALKILHAAKVRHDRLGTTRGALLWDESGVLRLADFLHSDVSSPTVTEGAPAS